MKCIYTFLLLLTTSYLKSQVITTIAGNGTVDRNAPNGPALSVGFADLDFCYVAFDNANNMYFTENFQNLVCKMDAGGYITTIAGTSDVLGYTGDGGPAVNALLYHTYAIAVDKNGNIYFGDQNGNLIRKIDPAGIITTASDGNGYTPQCAVGDGGTINNAHFNGITAIVFDQTGNMYISEGNCHLLRKINNAGIVRTVAGNGISGYSGDGGLATAASMWTPCKIAVDEAGNIYIPDRDNHRVRKVTPAGIISTIAGTGTPGYSGDGGTATQAQLKYPGSVVIDKAGNLYIGDDNQVIRKIDPSGIISTFAGTGVSGYTGDGGPASQAQIQISGGFISIDNNDNIYFIDEKHYVIRKITTCLSATISRQPTDTTLCINGKPMFSVTVAYANSLQWQENKGAGWHNLTDNAIYSGTTTNKLQITTATTVFNGYQYRCIATNPCGNTLSLTATLKVTLPTTPAISISAAFNDSCIGALNTFTAVTTNGGPIPVYQWQKNQNNVGSNSPTYHDNTLINGDVITCNLTSSNNCVTQSTAVSNSVFINVKPTLTPLVTVEVSDNNICTGTPVSFTANTEMAGDIPIFKWMKNNVPVGADYVSYTDNTLNNGDRISCTIKSTYSCPAAPTVTSNNIIMAVMPIVNPDIFITANATSVCRDSSIVFESTVLNGGSSPGYEWQVNNIAVGSNTPQFIDNNIQHGDVITCILTSNATCLSNTTATSNSIPITLFPDPQIPLDQNPLLCKGGSRLLDAGNFSSYLWNDGSTGRTLSVSNAGSYMVTVIDQNGCRAQETTTITDLQPSPSDFLPTDTSICTYNGIKIAATDSYKGYLWSDNSKKSTIKITTPGLYWLEVTDKNNCTGRDSIVVTAKNCPEQFYIPTAFSPDHDGKNDVFRPRIFGSIIKYNFIIYNRWGQIVFESKEPGIGWDGNYKDTAQGNSTFVWMCIFQLSGRVEEKRSGTVLVIK